MAKSSKGKSPTIPKAREHMKSPCVPETFKQHNLWGTSPMKEQFAPTDACPVPQHYKMAGG